MGFDKKEFSKQFPHIMKELKKKEMTLPIDEVQSSSQSDSGVTSDENTPKLNDNVRMEVVETGDEDIWRGFDPKVEDFIRRATNIDEAIEIIDYLLSRDEITAEKAKNLKEILEKEGLSAFGEHKRPGYYFEAAEKAKLQKQMKKSPLSRG